MMRMDDAMDDSELGEFIREWSKACGVRSGKISISISWMPWIGPSLSNPILRRQSTSKAEGEKLAMAVLKEIIYDKKATHMFIRLMQDKEEETGDNHRCVFVLFPNWLEAIEILTAIKRSGGSMSNEILATLYAFSMVLDSKSTEELVKEDKRAGRLKSFDPNSPRTATGAAVCIFHVGVVADQTNVNRWEKAVAAFTAVKNLLGPDKDSFALMNLLSEAKGKMDILELCTSLGMTIEEAWIAYSEAMDHRTDCSAGKQCVNSCEGLPQPVKLLRCSKCLMTKYCGEACQNLDWKEHKHRCSLLALIRAGIKKNLKSPEFKDMEEKIKLLLLEERSDPSLALSTLKPQRKPRQAMKVKTRRVAILKTTQAGFALVIICFIIIILKLM